MIDTSVNPIKRKTLRLLMLSFTEDEIADLGSYCEEHKITELELMSRCHDAVMEMINR
jgi:hypothetical protein